MGACCWEPMGPFGGGGGGGGSCSVGMSILYPQMVMVSFETNVEDLTLMVGVEVYEPLASAGISLIVNVSSVNCVLPGLDLLV